MHVHQQRCGVSSCETPTHDRICPTHRDELAALLRSIATGGVLRVRIHKDWDPVARKHIAREPEYDRAPGLWEELETTLVRQTKMGGASVKVHSSSHSEVSFHEDASTAKTETVRTIRYWKAVFSAANPHLSAGPVSPPDVCTWLASFPALLAQLPDAVLMHEDFAAIAHPKYGTIPCVVDRSPDRVFLGICGGRVDGYDYPCAENMYALDGAEWAVCRWCHTKHDVSARRAGLRAAIERHEATAVECSRLADSYGTAVTPDRIRQWRSRKKIKPVGWDEHGRPKYLMKTILDLAAGKKPAEEETAA